MTLPKIRPCPNCGNIYCVIYGYEWGWQHVECDECDYLGPGEGSKLSAIRAHNAASGMPLSENTEECLRPKAGSPVGNAETPNDHRDSSHD